MKKILIINIFGIGDVLFTSPVITNLKKQFPNCQIDYLANKRAEVLFQFDPRINDVFIYERDEWEASKKKSWIEYGLRLKQFYETLKSKDYDVVLDFAMNPLLNWLCFMAKIPQRIGFGFKKRGRWLTNRFQQESFPVEHRIESCLRLLKPFDIPIISKEMEFYLSSEITGWADSILQQHQMDGDNHFWIIVPGGGASWGKDARFKQWSWEKYAKLADKIVATYGAKIILLGDSRDLSLCEQIAANMQSSPVQLCGQTNLHQFAALAQKSRGCLLNDGGPLHMAVAAGAKTISLFGPVDPRVYGPYPQNGHQVVTQKIACQPCYRHFRRAQCDHAKCLIDLPVEEVFRKVVEQYENTVY